MSSQNFYNEIMAKLSYFIEFIKNSSLGEDCEVYDEFGGRLAATPLAKPTATVGISRLESENKWFGDYLGMLNGKDLYGKMVTVTFTITIHSPVTLGGSACTAFLCTLRDEMYGNKNLQVNKIESGDIKYDRSRRCLYMPIDFTVKYII